MAHPITLAGFAGSNLDVDPRLLAETVGVMVVDAQPGLGDLRPLHDRLTVATVPTSPQRQTIYRLGRDTPNDALYWLAWSSVVSVIRTFDGSDPTERIYFSGSGAPKYTDNVIALTGGAPYPQGDRPLGVPAPISPPVVTLTIDGTGTDGVRFYVSTFVNGLGWESAPSPPSAGLACKTGAVVAISALEAPPSGLYNITSRRIYATSPGTSGTAALLFLREIPIASTSTTDDARPLQDELATTGMLPPPANASGLIALWNSMAAAIVDKRVIFCEPGEPYAWPVKYDFPINDTPVALAKWEQNLLVLTTGAPVLLQGQDPSTMAETPAVISAACRSARSVVQFKHGVCWASNEGLAYSGSPTLLTQDIIGARQWKALSPASMIAARWGRYYVCSYLDTSNVRKGFMFDPLSPGHGVWWLSTGFDAAWFDDLAGELYVLEGGNVRKFDGALTLLPATFTSKQFRQTHQRNFSWGKVACNAYPVRVRVFCDGTLRATRSVTDALPFTLPSGFAALDWQIEVQTAFGNVQAVRLAVDISDFDAS